MSNLTLCLMLPNTLPYITLSITFTYHKLYLTLPYHTLPYLMTYLTLHLTLPYVLPYLTLRTLPLALPYLTLLLTLNLTLPLTFFSPFPSRSDNGL